MSDAVDRLRERVERVLGANDDSRRVFYYMAAALREGVRVLARLRDEPGYPPDKEKDDWVDAGIQMSISELDTLADELEGKND